MDKVLYFDMETYDPDLKERGSGYPFGTLKIISMGYKVDDGETLYTKDKEEMVKILNKYSIWVAHNISYELGCCKALGVDFKDKQLYCTMVGSILYDNTRFSHALGKLGKELFDLDKDQERFGRLVLEKKLPLGRNGIPYDYPKSYYASKDPEYIEKTKKKYIKAATNVAMSNLHIIEEHAPDLIEEYCKSDVDIQYSLHQKWLKELDVSVYNKFSNVNKVLVEMRHKGVRVDLAAAAKAKEELTDKIKDYEKIIFDYCPGINYNSSQHLAIAFDTLGIKYPLTEKGNPNIAAWFLDKCDHPIADAIVNAKKYTKARDEFIDNMFRYEHKGRIHGEMMLFGARRTGRFSHKNPNLGQIPSRDPIIGPMMRKIFIADKGEEWFSLDFSAQEPRLMVHYAALAQKNKVQFSKEFWDRNQSKFVMADYTVTFSANGIDKLVQAYKDNPALDSHTYNMNIINDTTGVDIDRTQTKTIALGKAYAMGVDKLAKTLDITKQDALTLTRAFDLGNPFIKELDAFCKYRMKTTGKIKTLGGRFTQSDGVDYKAMNKLIQGSAADQTALAMLMMYEEYNLIPQIVVHDEVNFSGSYEQAEHVKHCMENVFKLEIPSLTEIGRGLNWAEAK